MSGILAIIELNDFLHLLWFWHQAGLLHLGLDCVQEYVVVHLLHLHVREQICEQGVEERDVLPHKFRNVHVHYSLHQNQDLLR